MYLSFVPADDTDIDPLYQFQKELIDAYEDTATIAYENVLDWVRRKLQTHIGTYTRIEVAGNVVGYYHFTQAGDVMELDDLYLYPAYRNRGIGTCIIRDCIRASSLPIVLYVFIRNRDAVRLYERLGFRVTETIHKTRYLMRHEPQSEQI